MRALVGEIGLSFGGCVDLVPARLVSLLVHHLAKWALHSMVAFLALVHVVVKGANVGELAPGLAETFGL